MEEMLGDREELRNQIALFRYGLVAILLSKEERGELTRELEKLSKRNHTIPGSCRKKVSIPTLLRWLAAWRAGGFEALKPKLRNDYGKSRAIPPEWIQKAVDLRKAVPSRSATMLVAILSRLQGYPQTGINAHTLDDKLRKLGFTCKQARRVPQKRIRRWKAEHVNALWQGDATDGIFLPDPQNPEGVKLQTTLYLWIDDTSRLVPYAEFFFDEKLPRMERTLKMAILRRGIPSRLYVDNGKVFKASNFTKTLAELHIKRIHSRPRAPRGRGKIERFFGVLQEQFYPEVYAAEITTLKDLNEALWAWLEQVYHNRVHSETEKTPLQAYREGLEHVRLADPVLVARAFLWRVLRKVSKNGIISLLGNTYSVDPAWAGLQIELRFDPFDLSRLDVYRDARPVARAEVRKLAHGMVLELETLFTPPLARPVSINFIELIREEHRRQQAAEIGEIHFRDALKQ